MSHVGTDVLGLIAGEGVFPLEVARCAKRAGRRVACVALRDHTPREIDDAVAELTWIHPGEVGKGIAAFRRARVREAVMAGKFPKLDLLNDPAAIELDGDARRHLADLPDHRDDTLLARVALLLEQLGVRLLPQWALSPELMAGEGPLGKTTPTTSQWADIEFGLPIARRMGELDIGQTVVVRDRAVIAVEAIEGTDAALRRAGALARGGVAVKVSKPGQDPRFDVPAIGRRTVGVLAEAGVAVLAFEAGATIVLEREDLVEAANRHRIAVVGVPVPGAAEAVG